MGLILCSGFFFCHPLLAKGRRPPLDVQFTVEPSTVTAGHTLTVWCRSNQPLRHAALYFNERKARFYPAGETELRALMGVSSMEKPGDKEARFYAELLKGKVFQSTVAFHVEEGSYPVSRVVLPAQKDSLVASGQMERDAETLDRVYHDPQSVDKLWRGYFIMPTTGVISSFYGARRAYGQRSHQTAHTGMDIANDPGTPVVAPNRGRVVFSQWLDSFGNAVVLDHGLGVFSYYLHMQQAAVKKGDLLEKGAPIGEMGAEGVATGPHLHWSLVVAGERVDPLEWTEKEFR